MLRHTVRLHASVQASVPVVGWGVQLGLQMRPCCVAPQALQMCTMLSFQCIHSVNAQHVHT